MILLRRSRGEYRIVAECRTKYLYRIIHFLIEFSPFDVQSPPLFTVQPVSSSSICFVRKPFCILTTYNLPFLQSYSRSFISFHPLYMLSKNQFCSLYPHLQRIYLSLTTMFFIISLIVIVSIF